MASPDMRTLHPREVLRQVADHLNGQHNELSVTLPAQTTIGEAVRAAEAALKDVHDEHVCLMSPRVSTRRQIRETALKAVKMPNGLVGVLLGQSQCIDRLKIRCVPRSILLAKGDDIPEEFWGDIVVEEYLDTNGQVVPLSS